jgi:hypothetical protein
MAIGFVKRPESLGMLVDDGRMSRPPQPPKAALWLDKRGTPHLGRPWAELTAQPTERSTSDPKPARHWRLNPVLKTPVNQPVLLSPALARGHLAAADRDRWLRPRWQAADHSGPLKGLPIGRDLTMRAVEPADSAAQDWLLQWPTAPGVTPEPIDPGDSVRLWLRVEPDLSDCRVALGGEATLLVDGQSPFEPQIEARWSLQTPASAHLTMAARSAIGWSDRWLCLAVADAGLSPERWAEAMRLLGCEWALSLDRSRGPASLWCADGPLGQSAGQPPPWVSVAMIFYGPTSRD